MRELNEREVAVIRKNAESAAREIRRFCGKRITFDRAGLAILDRCVDQLPRAADPEYNAKTENMVADIFGVVAAGAYDGTWVDRGNYEALLELPGDRLINPVMLIQVRFALGRQVNLVSMLDSLSKATNIGDGTAIEIERDLSAGKSGAEVGDTSPGLIKIIQKR